MEKIIQNYEQKIKGLLKNLDTNNFPENFTCAEMILGTGNKFLIEIAKDCNNEESKLIADLNKLYACLEQELNQTIIDNLRITAYYLQIIRDKLGDAIFVICGFRPIGWELFRGRSGRSWHCLGFAADLTTNKLSVLWKLLKMFFPFGEKIFYDELVFVHFSRNR